MNGTNGISVRGGSSVSNSVASENGRDGIAPADAGTLIEGNAVHDNTAYGIRYSFGTGSYLNNVITRNGLNAVSNVGFNAGGNYCAGTGVVASSCP